ncbi:MAG: anthranilate phosphoribosyltransferase [Candidatus Jordarchaeales archaeon]|nr:anthranilate phosphoribosyltransferase [Candidatus Jordarchaeia archaeon]
MKEYIQKLVERVSLTSEEARDAMKKIMSGEATGAQIGAFLTALRMKGETVDEIAAFASVMREFCRRIKPRVNGRLVDTCGTGGDRVKTFNVSTASAFVVAGAGIHVAKHGNRSVTSRSGSADVLEKLGFNLNAEPERVERMIESVGVGFMFAPNFHPAMKHVAGPRREMGIRTVFNVLGPLTNPAGANSHVLGVYGEEWVMPVAEALRALGCVEAMVVHGVDGVDEISVTGETIVAWLRDGEISTLKLTPRDFNFEAARPEEVAGVEPEESAELTFKILNDLLPRRDPRRRMVLLNAAAGIVVGGKAEDLAHGVELAEESLRSGAAYGKLRDMISFSNGDMSKLEELEQRYA